MLKKRGFATIQLVQGLEAILDTLVGSIVQQVPIQTFLKIPFGGLPEFASHKNQLGTRMGEHIAEQQPQVSAATAIRRRAFS